MRPVVKVVLSVVAALLALGLAAGPAIAGQLADPAPARPPAVTLGLTAQAVSHAVDSPGETAPAGPNINQQNKQADKAKAHNKLIVGVIAAGLLVIVYFGHRRRAKGRVRKKNLQNAKG